MGKQEEMATLEKPNQKLEATSTMKKKKSEQTKCSDKCPSYRKLRGKPIKREAHENSDVANAESEANKGTSKILTTVCTWNAQERSL